METNKLVLCGLLALSVMSTPALAERQFNENQGGHHKQFMKQKHLKLTPEQQEQMKAIMGSVREKMMPMLQEKRALRMQIKGKMVTPDVKWADIDPLVDKLNALNGQITKLRIQTRLEVYQKAKVIMPHHPRHRKFH